MPRAKKPKQASCDIALRKAIAAHKAETECCDAQIYQTLKTSESTFYAHKRDPSHMTLKELRNLCDYFNFTDDEILEVVRI